MPTIREQLVSVTVDTFKAEYVELSDNWKSLDTKAQGNIAVCGIFVAGIFAFIKDGQHYSCSQRLFLTLTIALLSASIFSVVLVLRLRSVTAAPTGESLADLINELSKTPDLDDEAMINFMGDQARLWRETNAEVRGVNDRKAIFLNWSHGLLVAAIASAVVSSLLQLWK